MKLKLQGIIGTPGAPTNSGGNNLFSMNNTGTVPSTRDFSKEYIDTATESTM